MRIWTHLSVENHVIFVAITVDNDVGIKLSSPVKTFKASKSTWGSLMGEKERSRKAIGYPGY